MNAPSLTISYPYQDYSLCDLEGEIWKDIIGFEGYYQISNMGRAKSLSRTIARKRQGYVTLPDRILHQGLIKSKHTCRLSFAGSVEGSPCAFSVSRTVYSTFIKPLPDMKEERLIVMHKDDDLLNNRVENLYVLTHSQASKYYTRLERMSPPAQSIFTPELKQKIRAIVGSPVTQYDHTGKFIAAYNSIVQAMECTEVGQNNIMNAAQGVSKSAGGFIWKYGTNTSDLTGEELIQKTYKRFPQECKVNQYDLQGNFIATYRTISEAARALNIVRRSLSYHTAHAKPYMGYYWKYAIEDKA